MGVEQNWKALPLYATGLLVDSVLFYRYAIAIVLLAGMMALKKQSFALKKNEVLPLFVMGLLFSSSSLFLFQSFQHMDAGIASTILFVYPIIVAVIMAVFFIIETVSPSLSVPCSTCCTFPTVLV